MGGGGIDLPDLFVSIGGEAWRKIWMKILMFVTSPQSKQPSLPEDQRFVKLFLGFGIRCLTVFRIVRRVSIQIWLPPACRIACVHRYLPECSTSDCSLEWPIEPEHRWPSETSKASELSSPSRESTYLDREIHRGDFRTELQERQWIDQVERLGTDGDIV